MKMRWMTMVAGACLLAACSGSPTDPDDGDSGGGNNNPGGGQALTCPQYLGTAIRAQGTLTATINNVPWTADCIAILGNTSNILSVAGADLASGISFQTFGFATGSRTVGTQTIAALSTVTSTLVQGQSGWNASGAQGSGTLTFTTNTNNSAAGTFTFSLLPVSNPNNPATGTKNVTGSFNLTF